MEGDKKRSRSRVRNFSLKYRNERLQGKLEELIRINNTLNDKVAHYRNKFEKVNSELKLRENIVSNTSKSLLCDTVIGKLRATITNTEWRKYILENFN